MGPERGPRLRGDERNRETRKQHLAAQTVALDTGFEDFHDGQSLLGRHRIGALSPQGCGDARVVGRIVPGGADDGRAFAGLALDPDRGM